MASRDIREIVDLTKDDDSNSRLPRPRSGPTAKSIVIQISDSEDEFMDNLRLARPALVKTANRKRQPSQDAPPRPSQRPFSSFRGPTPVVNSNSNIGISKPNAVQNNVTGSQKAAPTATRDAARSSSQHHIQMTNRSKTPANLEPDRMPSKSTSHPRIGAMSFEQQRTSMTAKKEQFRSQALTKPPRIHCAECTETGLECDGERPCSRCVEPGLDCRYPGDLIIVPELRNNVNRTPAKAIAQVQHFRSTQGHSSPSTRSSLSNSSSGDADRPLVRQSTRSEVEKPGGAYTEQTDTEFYNKFPSCTWVPNSYEDVKNLVETSQENLNMQQEYKLQSHLSEAVSHAQQTAPSPSTTLRVNPFRQLLSNVKQNSKDQTEWQKLSTVKGASVKPLAISFPCTELGFDPKQPILPAYKSIGRLGTNFVARNLHTLKHLPYFPDEEDPDFRNERERNLNAKHRSGGILVIDEVHATLVKQRACLERLHRWSLSFADLLDTLKLTSEVILNWAQLETFRECEHCELRFDRVKPLEWTMPLPEEIRKCEWLFNAFHLKTKIPIWHFVEQKYMGKHEQSRLSMSGHQKSDTKPSLCAVCCVPNCIAHGLSVDGGKSVNLGVPLINDPETENNKRELQIPRNLANSSEHICGLYCTAGRFPVLKFTDLWGVDEEGVLSGFHRQDFVPVVEHAGFNGIVPCGQDCFITRSNRESWNVNVNDDVPFEMDQRERAFLETRVKLFGSSTRLPCSLARRLKMTCSKTFRCLVSLHRTTAGPHDHEKVVPINQGAKRSFQVPLTRYGDHNMKKPFLPCSHVGPCRKELGCRCAEQDHHCEFSCGCDESCLRRFPGCTCEGNCYENSKCLCWKYGRECDPWVCKSCGVVEVLDPSNKYNDEIRQGRCINNRIQLGLPARTFKAASQVQGWGLFAGEDIPKFTYIGEYKGEVITSGKTGEAERRGLVYYHGCLEYLFSLNTDQELDGSRYGNKMRFINHTKIKKNINLRSHRQLVNGVNRVSFWTERDVKAGEEFFYDYGYSEEETKNFWDIDTKQNTSSLLPIAKPHISKMGARHANETERREESEDSDDDEESAESPPPQRTIIPPAATNKQTKRKRKADDDDLPSLDIPVLQAPELRRTATSRPMSKASSRQASERKDASPGRGTKGVAYRAETAQDVNDNDDVDDDDEAYNEQDDASFDSASEAEIVDSDDEVLTGPMNKPKKKGRPRLTDRRRGGDAQRKAAVTRRKNRQNAGG